jgi:hypothetical protein
MEMELRLPSFLFGTCKRIPPSLESIGTKGLLVLDMGMFPDLIIIISLMPI